MKKDKLIIPTTLGEIESEISYSRETPEDGFSLFNMGVDILPIAVSGNERYSKDPFVDININHDHIMKMTFALDRINTKKASILEEKDYYHLKIVEMVRVPGNKQLALRVTIDMSLAKIMFKGKPSEQEILKKARVEMAANQSQFSPNADGRMSKGTYYGWGGSR